MTRLLVLTFMSLGALLPSGCDRSGGHPNKRAPRPVVISTLRMQLPPTGSLVTGSAAAWKTEGLGFEVAGRVEFVAEQNTEIEGRISDAGGNLIVEGTPIARIESERYELQVVSARASVAQSEQDLAIAQTDLDETIPAKIDAATATVKLAKVEFDRSNRLLLQKAGAESAVDTAKANYDTSLADLKELIALEKSQKAKIASLENSVLQAKQSLRDATRDLEDCTLYSSFRGLVASTSVVPGSLVKAGDPVVTLQMMDPMMVELEVSAEYSRKLRRTETLPVHVTMPDGRIEVREGFLHQIDPSADPLTRTFTLTVLVLNQHLTKSDEVHIATTRDTWRLDLTFIPGADKQDFFVEETAILTDEQGSYLWQVTNATIQSQMPVDHIFKVCKLRVDVDDFKVPYLGDYVFQRIKVQDESFNPNQNIVIGKLNVVGMPANQWNGEEVLLDSPNRWMLRPGDLVQLDLSEHTNDQDGYYVPMDAISIKGSDASIFIVESTGETTTVKRIPVTVEPGTDDSTVSSLRRIEPIGDANLDGVQYVTKGTHFLIDGETVTVVLESGAGE